jgi:hypothetical protein
MVTAMSTLMETERSAATPTTMGEVVLETFTPDIAGQAVVGSVTAQLTNVGTGDTFTLEGEFDAPLVLMP